MDSDQSDFGNTKSDYRNGFETIPIDRNQNQQKSDRSESNPAKIRLDSDPNKQKSDWIQVLPEPKQNMTKCNIRAQVLINSLTH